MTEQSPAEVIFFAALEKGTAEERIAYLKVACGDDSNLRQRVERLLAAHPQVGSFLEPAAPAKTGAAEASAPPAGESFPEWSSPAETTAQNGPSEGVGSVIAGRYKLLETLGQGGMGAVFMAQQTEPVKRLVALKLIKLGMDSRQILTRFAAERQALALMDHPNIAKVLDAGATDSGRPFFVMELVKGVPITHFCDLRQLSTRERLELFIPVCHAIQHAHQKGVIHRDIKPTNVLVALYDDRPVPKVIDFGVAKAAGSQLTDDSLVTRFGAIVGTPEYMSPEQAQLNQLDVDTRSDVYALGVLLYELLTGTTPIDRKRLGQGALLEILRVIREEEPLRPSARLSTSEALASIAATRRTEPTELTRIVRGELDWIVMKCLEKERSRRYETANGLARDLERYLHDDVVEAQPPGAGYRLRKFVRKHRVAITTVSAFVGLMIAAAGISAALAIKARRAEMEAMRNAHEAQDLAQSRAVALGQLNEREQELRLELSKSAVTASSRQLDLDLTEVKTEPRNALLKLARTAHALSMIQVSRLGGRADEDQLSRLSDLRTFAAAAIIRLGQDFAPLLRPLSNDWREPSWAVNRPDYGPSWAVRGPDGRTLLTTDEMGTVRLWDLRTASQTALLREDTERSVACGFSPDSETIFTNDAESVIRFWAASDGRFLSKSGLRATRFVYPKHLTFPQIVDFADDANPVCMTNSTAIVGSYKLDILRLTRSEERWTTLGHGPAELIDVATGRVVARLDRPGHNLGKCQVSPDGRWIIAVEDDTQVVIFSAANGRVVGRLVHPPGTMVRSVGVSPNTRRILTRLAPAEMPNEMPGKGVVWLWEPDPWRHVPDGFLDELAGERYDQFLTDDVIAITPAPKSDVPWYTEALYRIGGSSSPAPANAHSITAELGGELFRYDGTKLLDGQSFKRLTPPAGRKFHPALKRLTSDGRFYFGDEIIDTATEKQIPGGWRDSPRPKCLSGFGTITSRGWQVRILPAPQNLELPPDLLELWAQVVVRGHLDDEGAFVKWDEPTWEKKRQELASKPAPNAGFPFPGHVAVDRLFWLRQEFESANDTDKPRLATQLLEGANAAGDRSEALRWVAVLAGNLVNSLASKLLLRTDVEEHLRQDASLNSEIRAAALLQASELVEDANDLNNASWPIAARPNAEKEEYRRALRWAKAAVRNEPENPDIENTLGVLQYRNGLYREAISTLTRSHEAHRTSKAGAQPSDLAFLTLAHHAVGESDKARDYLRQLAALCDQPQWKADEEAGRFLKEARQRLALPP